MWATVNKTPYRVDSAWGRDKHGVHEWIVAVKATFDIRPDGCVELSDEQLDPLYSPEFTGLDGVSSLRYEADLVAPKPTTDFVVNATAYAPKGKPSKEFYAQIRVGDLAKTLRVLGNREWKKASRHPRPSAIDPITEVPVIYEKAYGGYDSTNSDPEQQKIDARNPVGLGVATHPSNLVGQPLPNFEYPKGEVDKVGPAGFGAIANYWSPRLELQGTYDAAWQRKRCPLLPEDWDPRSLLASPPDQHCRQHLRGNERVELLNLTPSGKLVFALPAINLSFNTQVNRRIVEHAGQLATVVIEPNYPRVIMVWLTSLACPTNVDYLEETIVREV